MESASILSLVTIARARKAGKATVSLVRTSTSASWFRILARTKHIQHALTTTARTTAFATTATLTCPTNASTRTSASWTQILFHSPALLLTQLSTNASTTTAHTNASASSATVTTTESMKMMTSAQMLQAVRTTLIVLTWPGHTSVLVHLAIRIQLI